MLTTLYKASWTRPSTRTTQVRRVHVSWERGGDEGTIQRAGEEASNANVFFKLNGKRGEESQRAYIAALRDFNNGRCTKLRLNDNELFECAL